MKRKAVRSKPQEPIYDTKQVISDLLAARPAIDYLRQKGKPYDPLVELLMASPDECHRITYKDLCTSLHISIITLKKWVGDLYANFLRSIEEKSSLVVCSEIEHEICLSGPKGYVFFRCHLSYTPRVGEQFDVDFASAVTGTAVYYVDAIHSRLEGSKVVITITARRGYYNPYRALLIERARFENRLPFDYYKLPDDELDELLRKMYPR